jgi:hypothetical protein
MVADYGFSIHTAQVLYSAVKVTGSNAALVPMP